MANEAVVLSAANLNTIENNIGHLADNIGQVSLNVVEVDSKVNEVTATVASIEEEIKNFMVEIKGSTIVSNAKQSIMMSQAELEKKIGHYDLVRRKINGILQASDMHALTKENLKNTSEESLINTPNYWLSPALSALSAWLLNDKIAAEIALSEAMRRDDEKTSLLFSLIHARAGRYESSNKWLRRYLDMQDPLAMEAVILIVLDAITSGALGVQSIDLVKEKIEAWKMELANADINKDEIKKLNTFIGDLRLVEEENYPFIKDYTNEYENLNKSVATTKSKGRVLSYFKNIYEEKIDDNSKDKKIDRILDLLVFNCENEELDLKRDIARNKFIIEENGNVAKADERFVKSEFAYDKASNFYSLLISVAIGLREAAPTVKKLAVALCKDIIITAYEEILKDTGLKQEEFIKVNINEWSNEFKDGSEENHAINNLNNYYENLIKIETTKIALFDYKMLISIIVGIISIFFMIKIPALAVAIIVAVAAFNIYQLTTAFMFRTKIEEQYRKKLDEDVYILYNIIAEIVDYRILSRKAKKIDSEFISFINNLNYLDYIKIDGHRKIMIGGNNE